MSQQAVEDEWVVVPYRVIYGDTDAMGIVYYATYLRFLELGRNEYLRARGTTYRDVEAGGWRLPVTEVRAKYHASARYDDELRIATRVEEVGKVQLRFGYRVTRASDDLLLLNGSTVHACLDATTLKVRRLPEEVRRWLPAAS